jgi:hypothetical protein
MRKKQNDENLMVAVLTCMMAVIGVMTMRVVLKLDFQSWALVYLAAAATAAIRWTPSGSNISIGSALRSMGCLVMGLYAIRFAGYPVAASFQTASLVPHEILEAFSYFHALYE